ncbi:hypothetical protein [Marinobacter salicampi]|uniref:hypothetical protein n=1 Tax=Marinobacter salicampi TaxID=435907 RepID=UPI001F5FF4DD|nr:hypothetical protein [Marinobacter salicampi]
MSDKRFPLLHQAPATGYWSALLLVLLSTPPGQASEDESCLASAQSPNERVYCQVVSQGAGQSLPSLVDFRRNDPQVQLLLLKRPAAALGIVLADQSESPKPPSGPTAEATRPLPSHDRDRSVGSGTSGGDPLARCQLKGATISCHGKTYKLVANQQNRELADGALALANRLDLPGFEGGPGDDAEVRAYLSGAYDRYIAGMLSIGLGANTMSFTRFHRAFYRMQEERVDFAGRMEETFQLLKKDKQTLGVQDHYTDKLPQDLNACAEAGRGLIVCDDIATNWVYRRQR